MGAAVPHPPAASRHSPPPTSAPAPEARPFSLSLSREPPPSLPRELPARGGADVEHPPAASRHSPPSEWNGESRAEFERSSPPPEWSHVPERRKGGMEPCPPLGGVQDMAPWRLASTRVEGNGEKPRENAPHQPPCLLPAEWRHVPHAQAGEASTRSLTERDSSAGSDVYIRSPPNTKHQTLNSKHKASNTKHQTPHSKQ